MKALIDAIPDPEILLELTPEELGAKLLLLLPKEQHFHPGNFSQHTWQGTLPERWRVCNESQRKEAEIAIAEAWAWLQAQGLVIPQPSNGQYGWQILSRRARTFQSEADIGRFAQAGLLPKQALHARLTPAVWLSFMRGEFDTAVFQALKMVEVAVREASGLPQDLLGTKLMRKAFDPDSGPLTDMESEKGEREALSALFAGAIGTFKNPQSHREVNLDDPITAIEIILLANHLIRVVDSRALTRTTG